ncbi:MAG: DMT family transporter [Gammaproteobacteria bacterium]|nr:DMT family transporter [Gammaproteobacteria bacterium]
MGARDWMLLVSLSLLWGGSFFLIELAITGLPPLTIVLLRVSLAAAALWIYAGLRGLNPPRKPGAWRAFLTMGCLNNVAPFVLIVWGQTHITSGLASILNATAPLFTIIVAGLLLADERITLAKTLGVLAGFSGVVLMMGPAALRGVGSELLAQCAILLAAFCYACAGVFGRRFQRMGVDPVVTAAGQVTASSLVLAPLAIGFDQPWLLPLPSILVIAAIVILALLSTALAYILYFRLLATAGATNLLLVTFLIPISAILLGTLLLGESLSGEHYLGMGLIGLGLVAIDGRAVKRLVKR